MFNFRIILYTANKIPAVTKTSNTLSTIISLPNIFKNTAQIIGNSGEIIMLISLYGSNPFAIHLAKLYIHISSRLLRFCRNMYPLTIKANPKYSNIFFSNGLFFKLVSICIS